jgi:hypothetical protein
MMAALNCCSENGQAIQHFKTRVEAARRSYLSMLSNDSKEHSE